jgi:hypothetical protein
MVAVMGESVLDLRQTTLPPSGDASVDVSVVMGGAVLRVPAEWALDVQAVSVLGSFHYRRRAPFAARAAPSPGPTARLVVTGNVVMGELAIVSDSSGH